MNQRSLISISDLERVDVSRILRMADQFAETGRRDNKKIPTLQGRTIINMFFEASTRTLTSFELAGKRMSADVINIKGSGSAVDKGESLKDTILTLDSYNPDVIVIRHSSVGACQLAQKYTRAAVINAGDGRHEHPTQTLLDIYTVEEEWGQVEKLNIAFVGDILNSRVARSGIKGFQMMGATVAAIAPPMFLPREMDIYTSSDIRDIQYADIIYVLRMQNERISGHIMSLREYTAEYMVHSGRLKPHQLVMHAGPMNRGVEISGELADNPICLVRQQAANGLPIRQAVLYDLLNSSSEYAIITE